MKLKQKALESPCRSVCGDKETSNRVSLSSEEEPLRRVRESRRAPCNSNDFKVEISKFPDEFLEWLHTAEWIFNYKDILEDKKAKLVTLRL